MLGGSSKMGRMLEVGQGGSCKVAFECSEFWIKHAISGVLRTESLCLGLARSQTTLLQTPIGRCMLLGILQRVGRAAKPVSHLVGGTGTSWGS